jgi:hypothetical protein
MSKGNLTKGAHLNESKSCKLRAGRSISKLERTSSIQLSESMERTIWWCIVELKWVSSFPLWNRIWTDSDKLLRGFLTGRCLPRIINYS